MAAVSEHRHAFNPQIQDANRSQGQPTTEQVPGTEKLRSSVVVVQALNPSTQK